VTRVHLHVAEPISPNEAFRIDVKYIKVKGIHFLTVHQAMKAYWEVEV
jgi:hypothetical protein